MLSPWYRSVRLNPVLPTTEELNVSNRRVAVVGMFLESNAFARTVPELGFRGFLYLEGDAISNDARAEHPRVMSEVVGFYSAMDRLGPWESVPILVTMSGGGSVEHAFFERTVAEVSPLAT